jgi:hypothetical protein
VYIENDPWRPVGPDGTIANRNAKYIQYRATLATSDTMVTPALERVEITYEDAQGPTITRNRPTGAITDRTPRISAVVRDETTDLAKEDIRLYLDGRPKGGFSYDRATNRLTFNTSTTLSYGCTP